MLFYYVRCLVLSLSFFLSPHCYRIFYLDPLVFYRLLLIKNEITILFSNLKVKEGDAKRKQKRAAKNPGAEDTGIDIKMEEGSGDEEGTGFFEDAPVFDENASFSSMNLSRPLLKAIEQMRFVHPTPIQAATIPVALLGRDICGCAATGTGKTAAYMLPVLERLLYRPKDVAVTRVLVLVPTRELGVQVHVLYTSSTLAVH